MEMTIKELADELGVNKRKVTYRVNQLATDLYTKRDNVIYINEQGISEIKAIFGINETIHEESTEQPFDYTKNLFEQLAVKDRQIENLQKALETQQKLLDQQQKLSAEDKRILAESPKRVALEPVESTEESCDDTELVLAGQLEELSTKLAQYLEENQQLAAEISQLQKKKWYQFWK